MSRNPLTCLVPPYLLRQLIDTQPDLAEHYQRVLDLDQGLRQTRATATASPSPVVTTGEAWVVHTADNTTTLPGRRVRAVGEPESGDAAVDEAAYGVAGSLDLFAQVYDRSSYDGAGATVSATVHYGQDYDNAFWDGAQLVFGDGDGRVFGRFTASVDVLAHEFSHGVVEHTAGLVYRGQSGALNESVSDVFAACLKQRLLGQSAAEGDWLIGAEIFVPAISARGLRDMANPGTAYDDPALGKDPQPAHMDDFIVTTDDNGGVHLNSGIPNRAFHLAATALGGSAAEGAGRIWYAALTGDSVGPRADFATFAAATVAAAGSRSAAVEEAWQAVGVTPGVTVAPTSAPTPSAGSRQVSVTRSGGLMGRTVGGRVDLDAEDRKASELRGLVERIDLAAVAAPASPMPDRFVYDFDLCGDCATVPEQRLTDDLRRVADIVLEDPFDR